MAIAEPDNVQVEQRGEESMANRRIGFALVVIGLGILVTAAASAQVSVSFGIHTGFRTPAVHSEVIIADGTPTAVWIGGHWVWSDYAGRNVWIAGHWVIPHSEPVYREHRVRHIPRGVAKGWWKKHGHHRY